MEYNGWTNRETWLINVWFNPECVDDVRSIRDLVDIEYHKLNGFMKDLCNVEEINWDELEEAMEF